MTPVDEVRAAAARLRCNHAFSVLPPYRRPSDCHGCGVPYKQHEVCLAECLICHTTLQIELDTADPPDGYEFAIICNCGEIYWLTVNKTEPATDQLGETS